MRLGDVNRCEARDMELKGFKVFFKKRFDLARPRCMCDIRAQVRPHQLSLGSVEYFGVIFPMLMFAEINGHEVFES